MSPAVVIPIRRASAPGKGDVWTLELAPGQASLRDPSGELRNVFAPEDAARDWTLPNFIDTPTLTLPTDKGPASFRCESKGLRHIRMFVQAGAAQSATPKSVRRTTRRALAEIVIGGVMLLIGLAGITVSIAGSMVGGGTPALAFGFPLIGLVVTIHGVTRLREALAIEKQISDGTLPPAAAPQAPPVVLPPPRRGPRVVQLFIWGVGGSLAAIFIVTIGVVVASTWFNPAPPAPSAPTPPPSPAAPSGVTLPPGPQETDAAAPMSASDAPAVEPAAPEAASPHPTPSPPDSTNVILAGAVELVDPPVSVRAGALVSADTARLFIERKGRVLTGRLRCDATRPAIIRTGSPAASGEVEAGQRVDSYMLHVNAPAGDTSRIEGSITFPTAILGIIINQRSLDASDGPLGRDGLAYPTGGQWRGWLDGSPDDWIEIAPDRRTLTFRSNTNRWTDQIRIVVESP